MGTPGLDETVEVGRFTGAWGVNGWVKVYSLTDPAEAIFDYQPWLVGEAGQSMTISHWRRTGPRLVAAIDGIETAEQAAALAQVGIRIRRDILPPAPAGQFYWNDLIGLTVVNREGDDYGRVSGLQATGAHDVLEIAGGPFGPVLIPFVQDHFIDFVDLEAGRIVVNWPREWLDAE